MTERVSGGRQSMMFSATFPREVQMMARDFMRDYLFLAVGRVGSASELVEQIIYHAEERGGGKMRELLRAIEEHLPDKGLCLIFVETKRGADVLERDLYDRGWSCTTIHGDRAQHEREAALSAFRSGRKPVLIATDVASRGLDIPNVHLVVNYDMPKAIDDYVHRIGRTGRAGRKGSALSFVNDRSRGLVRPLYELLMENGQEVPKWLSQMCAGGGFGGGYSDRRGGGRGGGGHKFGA